VGFVMNKVPMGQVSLAIYSNNASYSSISCVMCNSQFEADIPRNQCPKFTTVKRHHFQMVVKESGRNGYSLALKGENEFLC
jgi:hypothetical protein